MIYIFCRHYEKSGENTRKNIIGSFVLYLLDVPFFCFSKYIWLKIFERSANRMVKNAIQRTWKLGKIAIYLVFGNELISNQIQESGINSLLMTRTHIEIPWKTCIRYGQSTLYYIDIHTTGFWKVVLPISVVKKGILKVFYASRRYFYCQLIVLCQLISKYIGIPKQFQLAFFQTGEEPTKKQKIMGFDKID